MANGRVTRESFRNMTTDSKLDVLYDHVVVINKRMDTLQQVDQDQNSNCDIQWHKCDERFKKTEKFVTWVMGGFSGVAFLISVVSLVLHLAWGD